LYIAIAKTKISKSTTWLKNHNTTKYNNRSTTKCTTHFYALQTKSQNLDNPSHCTLKSRFQLRTPITNSQQLFLKANSSTNHLLAKLHRESNISSPNPCEWPHGAIRVSPIQSEKAICHILWYQYWHQHGYLHAQLYMHYCWCLQEWQPELQRDIQFICIGSLVVSFWKPGSLWIQLSSSVPLFIPTT